MLSINIPCQRLNFFVIRVGMNAISIKQRDTGISMYAVCIESRIKVPPDTNAQIGKIKLISMIFAPTTFPTERDDCFFAIAVIVVTSSGKLVPIAIKVKPIISKICNAHAVSHINYSILIFCLNYVCISGIPGYYRFFSLFNCITKHFDVRLDICRAYKLPCGRFDFIAIQNITRDNNS